MGGRLASLVGFMKEVETATVMDGVVDLVALCDLAQCGAMNVRGLGLSKPRILEEGVNVGSRVFMRDVKHPVIKSLTRVT